MSSGSCQALYMLKVIKLSLYFCRNNMEKVMYYLLLERKERRPSSADVVPKAIRKEHAHILGKLHHFFKLSWRQCISRCMSTWRVFSPVTRTETSVWPNADIFLKHNWIWATRFSQAEVSCWKYHRLNIIFKWFYFCRFNCRSLGPVKC
jgi:hypothetical protein